MLHSPGWGLTVCRGNFHPHRLSLDRKRPISRTPHCPNNATKYNVMQVATYRYTVP